ncbi:hypothetical protein ccbrp13_38510 [Ktedonobacteria bacterium brp13]|nr:hypothetical protein ccbrp13_38510 [Ktedonobacteria bacterium brp13]
MAYFQKTYTGEPSKREAGVLALLQAIVSFIYDTEATYALPHSLLGRWEGSVSPPL